jgi:uncharacterized protein with PQ loop repeat
LPVILKNYDFHKRKEHEKVSMIVFVGSNFGIFPFLEFINLYAMLPETIKINLQGVLAYV